MPRISSRHDFNGFVTKSGRLKLASLVEEAESTLESFELLIAEARFVNGTRGLRQKIDDQFRSLGGWEIAKVGGIDWQKSGSLGAQIGVEVQVSGRSDMLAVDIMHFKEAINKGLVDVGLIIVPDDSISRFLTDRTPNLATALKHVNDRASDMPIRVVAFAHDGVGSALPKMRTNLGRA